MVHRCILIVDLCIQEVEEAVLVELIDQILKPVSVLRNMKVINYGEKRGSVEAPQPVSGKDQALLEVIDRILAMAKDPTVTDRCLFLF